MIEVLGVRYHVERFIPVVTAAVGGAIFSRLTYGAAPAFALEGLRMPDYPLVLTIVALTAVITMVGVLLSDLLYALIDPRIGYGKEAGR